MVHLWNDNPTTGIKSCILHFYGTPNASSALFKRFFLSSSRGHNEECS